MFQVPWYLAGWKAPLERKKLVIKNKNLESKNGLSVGNDDKKAMVKLETKSENNIRSQHKCGRSSTGYQNVTRAGR